MSFLFIFLLQPGQPIFAQPPVPFLISPYYGYGGWQGGAHPNSYFDHKYPTRDSYPNTTYPNVMIYTGAESASCNPYCYNGHEGIDFDVVYDSVLASAGGTVVAVRWNDLNNRFFGLGLYIKIDHGSGYHTLYGHLSAVAVEVGDTVLAGQVIGTGGTTGNSTGPHLHFGLRLNGDDVDPFGWSGSGTDPWFAFQQAASYCLWLDGEWADICGGVSRPIPEPAHRHNHHD